MNAGTLTCRRPIPLQGIATRSDMVAPRDHKWFANRGHMLQIAINALALLIGGKETWKDLMNSQFFSLGALLFYALVGLVVMSFLWWVREAHVRSSDAQKPVVDLKPIVLEQMRQKCQVFLDTYKRLDYTDRERTQVPFN